MIKRDKDDALKVYVHACGKDEAYEHGVWEKLWHDSVGVIFMSTDV